MILHNCKVQDACKPLDVFFFMIVQIPNRLTLDAHHQSMGPKSLCDDYFTKL
jgi:hypothetical protein